MTQKCLMMGLCQVPEELLNAHLCSLWIIPILSRHCLRVGEVLFHNIFRVLSSRYLLTCKLVKEIRTHTVACALLNYSVLHWTTREISCSFPAPSLFNTLSCVFLIILAQLFVHLYEKLDPGNRSQWSRVSKACEWLGGGGGCCLGGFFVFFLTDPALRNFSGLPTKCASVWDQSFAGWENEKLGGPKCCLMNGKLKMTYALSATNTDF